MSNKPDTGQYPEGDNLTSFIKSRKRLGYTWQLTFLAATIVAVIALMALLYNIVIGSFGYVAVQSTIDPASLVLKVDEQNMLTSPNTLSSEDDNELANAIIGNPNAIGFFGYAYYNDNRDKLKILSIDGVAASPETAESGTYSFSRPLFIYTTAELMQEKPVVSAFVNYYLTNINNIVEEIGYFPNTAESQAAATRLWLEANATGGSTLPAVEPATFGEDDSLELAGSSTVYPLSRQMLIDFRKAGYAGGIGIESVGTSAGFELFCRRDGTDIVNASRPINRAEIDACKAVQREPLAFRVGTDALAVVVSRENTFLENLTTDELRQIFTGAETWAEVNPAWPDTPIERFIPGQDSGTLDFFAESVFSRGLEELPKESLLAILEQNLSAGLIRRFNAEGPLVDRSQEELLNLVAADIAQNAAVLLSIEKPGRAGRRREAMGTKARHLNHPADHAVVN